MPTAEEAFDFFTRDFDPEEEPAVEKADTEKKEKAEGEEGEEPKEGDEEEVINESDMDSMLVYRFGLCLS